MGPTSPWSFRGRPVFTVSPSMCDVAGVYDLISLSRLLVRQLVNPYLPVETGLCFPSLCELLPGKVGCLCLLSGTVILTCFG